MHVLLSSSYRYAIHVTTRLAGKHPQYGHSGDDACEMWSMTSGLSLEIRGPMYIGAVAFHKQFPDSYAGLQAAVCGHAQLAYSYLPCLRPDYNIQHIDIAPSQPCIRIPAYVG
jgi:hypothetical protein